MIEVVHCFALPLGSSYRSRPYGLSWRSCLCSGVLAVAPRSRLLKLPRLAFGVLAVVPQSFDRTGVVCVPTSALRRLMTFWLVLPFCFGLWLFIPPMRHIPVLVCVRGAFWVCQPCHACLPCESASAFQALWAFGRFPWCRSLANLDRDADMFSAVAASSADGR